MEVSAGSGDLSLPVDRSRSVSRSESDEAHDSLPAGLSLSPSRDADAQSPAALKERRVSATISSSTGGDVITASSDVESMSPTRLYSSLLHLVIETSQAITDVPYGDYFCVQTAKDPMKAASCMYTFYVAFSKGTVLKGKIVQSTIEDCREAYALWTEMAHELLTQKNLEKKEGSPAVGSIQNDAVQIKREVVTADASGRLSNRSERVKIARAPVSEDLNQQAANIERESFHSATEAASSFGGYSTRFSKFLKNQSQVSLIAFIAIFLMQVSILVLLSRPRTVNIAPSGGFYVGDMSGGLGGKSPESAAWLERRMHHLKDEM